MRHKHIQIIVKNSIWFAAVALLTACNKTDNSTSGNGLLPSTEKSDDAIQITQEQMEVSGIKLDGFTEHTFHNMVSATGMIDVPPENKASVSTYNAGYVSEIHILSGQKVAQGEVLFTLENPEYVSKQQDFLDARAQLSYLKADYDRQKTLLEDQVSSHKKYTKAESEYQTMLVRYEALKKQLELMHINTDKLDASNITSTINVKAPIGGYLSNVNVNRGMYLEPSDIAATIINPEHLHIELSIFEKDLQYVKPGQEIVFNLLNDPENKYIAEVYLVGKSVNPEKRTINVHGHLRDKKVFSQFTQGMYLEANIFTTSENLISLPNEAVFDSDDRHYVVLQQKNQDGEMLYLKQEIKAGKRNNLYTQIINVADFPEDATFIVEGGFNLFMD